MALALACALPAPCAAAGYEPVSLGLQARIGERRVIGKVSPESFEEYDLAAAWRTPLERRFASGFTIGARLLTNVGVFKGPGHTAAVASLVPVLALGTADARFTLDGGLGLGLLSEHRYGSQDFGGPVQFALTVGISAPVYGHVGIGYRFQHYSDGGLYGTDTIGADLHMAALLYRF